MVDSMLDIFCQLDILACQLSMQDTEDICKKVLNRMMQKPGKSGEYSRIFGVGMAANGRVSTVARKAGNDCE